MTAAENPSALFPKGESAPAEYFTGTTWLKVLAPGDDALHCQVANVTFEAGARTHWHTHKGGQILIITDGMGWYQEKGKSAQAIRKGDVVRIQPEVMHWHGAAADSPLTHIAVNPNAQDGVVEWLGPVTDEEYNHLRTA